MSEEEIDPIKTVEAVPSTKKAAMSEALAAKVANFTELQKRYAEYRAKGLKQADACQKAGSKAAGRSALSRVGYGFEQLEGMKEYITYLYEKRARAAVLDEIEIVEGLRDVVKYSMLKDNYNAANKALELMGLMIGAFAAVPKAKPDRSGPKQTKNNTDAFKAESQEDFNASDKMKNITNLMKTLKVDKPNGQ